MENGLLIYMIAQHLVASHGGVTRCITPDSALLPTWKDIMLASSATMHHLYKQLGLHRFSLLEPSTLTDPSLNTQDPDTMVTRYAQNIDTQHTQTIESHSPQIVVSHYPQTIDVQSPQTIDTHCL